MTGLEAQEPYGTATFEDYQANGYGVSLQFVSMTRTKSSSPFPSKCMNSKQNIVEEDRRKKKRKKKEGKNVKKDNPGNMKQNKIKVEQ